MSPHTGLRNFGSMLLLPRLPPWVRRCRPLCGLQGDSGLRLTLLRFHPQLFTVLRFAGRRTVNNVIASGADFQTGLPCRPDHRMRTPNVLAAGILISAALFSGACNRTQPQDDKTITKEIQAKLYHDATLKTRDISIIAQNGVVVLSGQVNSEDERASAEHVAAAVGGVKQVINQLAVVGPSPATIPPQQAARPQRSKGAGAPP